MILVVDNYDSFTFNLVQLFACIERDVRVVRNDERTVEQIEALAPAGILLSPGPGRPEGAGITLSLIAKFAHRTPILGVCLGHQSIAEAFGAKVVHAERLMHGRTSPVSHDGKGVFRGMPSPFTAMRYHSLIVDPATIPPGFSVTASTDEGEVMGLRSNDELLEGVQFHPESFMSEHGAIFARNFVDRVSARGVASLGKPGQ